MLSGNGGAHNITKRRAQETKVKCPTNFSLSMLESLHSDFCGPPNRPLDKLKFVGHAFAFRLPFI